MRYLLFEREEHGRAQALVFGQEQRRLFQLLLLAASTWAVTYGRLVLGPLQEAMRLDLTLTDNQLAWLQGPAIAIPMALGSIPLGLLVDRYPRVRVFQLFVLLTLVAAVLTAFAFTFAWLLTARVLAGLALAAILVAAYSMMADLYAPARRGRATMVVVMGEIGGGPAAFALGGVLLAMAGPAPDSWRSALLWMCVPLIPAVLLMLTLREPPRTGVIVENPPLCEVWPQLWRYRGAVIPLLLARIMVWIADGAVVVWGAPTFARQFALPPERIGAIMAMALLVSGLLGPVLGGPLADYCQRGGGPRRTVTALAVIALLSAPAALFALLPSATLASLALAVFLTLGFTISVVAMTLSTIVIPGELRALYLAVSFAVGATFSIGVAPLVVSSLAGALGGPSMIGQALAIIGSATSVLGALVFGFARRYFPREAQPTNAPCAQLS